MPSLPLVIGNENYPSWSRRPSLVLREAGIPFGEVHIPLYQSESAASALPTRYMRRWCCAFRPMVALEGAAHACAEAILALPVLHVWVADAVAETERIEPFDPHEKKEE